MKLLSSMRDREASRLPLGGLHGTTLLLALVAILLPAGCGTLAYRLTSDVPQQYVPNPLELPAVADDFLWLQVVDTLDDYFRIARQQPVVNSQGIVLEGKIETSYKVAGSIFQPWQKDNTTGFERLQSTLQTIRRRAIVTVRPDAAGYSVEVIVQKDLEDTDRTQNATESIIGTRHDGTRISRADTFGESPQTLGWIPLGRDTSLEQAILKDIFGRVTQPDG
ncbi:hypothetical protein [Allorhodopirellula solitaria]|uniref:Uncharacterized protein n=1 Tax=Allorhodopirellula solitaria TaxID=2527987 RepID=A0A5C5YKF5_9BACT|nr:hypothetical protein [Allorhodopirellula solitaria]TWT75327.1 hypothetical protein CA85_06180 [Allorhodopirellula solitaria]